MRHWACTREGKNHRRKVGNLGRHRATLVSSDAADSSLRRDVLKRDPHILDVSTLFRILFGCQRSNVWWKRGRFRGDEENSPSIFLSSLPREQGRLFSGSIPYHCSVPVSSHSELCVPPPAKTPQPPPPPPPLITTFPFSGGRWNRGDQASNRRCHQGCRRDIRAGELQRQNSHSFALWEEEELQPKSDVCSFLTGPGPRRCSKATTRPASLTRDCRCCQGLGRSGDTCRHQVCHPVPLALA